MPTSTMSAISWGVKSIGDDPLRGTLAFERDKSAAAADRPD
jgi:hypothetical protein